MRKTNAGPLLTNHARYGIRLPQSRLALIDRAHARASVCLAVFATMAVAAPAFSQTSKPASRTTVDSCAGVMEHLDEARTHAPGDYTKVLVGADARCLGVMERADKARMITRDEYVKAYKREPDCSAAAYSYICQ